MCRGTGQLIHLTGHCDAIIHIFETDLTRYHRDDRMRMRIPAGNQLARSHCITVVNR